MEDFIVHGRVTQSVALMAGCMATNVPCVLKFCKYRCGFFGGTQKAKWEVVGMMSENYVELRVCCGEFLSSFMFSINRTT